MAEFDILGWWAVAVLFGCLCLSVGWRHRFDLKVWLLRGDGLGENGKSRATYSHAGFDASTVLPRVDCLRHSHVAVAHDRFRPHPNRRVRLAAAREAIAWLTFFQPRSTHPMDPGEQTHREGL